MRMQQSGWGVSLVAIAVMILPVDRAGAQALDTGLQVSSGYWTNASHWNNGVPTSDDDAFLGSSTIGGVTPASCILDSAGQQCDRIYIGHNAGNSGQLDIAGGDLTVFGALGTSPAVVGNRGTGTVNQTSGMWDNGGNSFVFGQYSGAHGTYTLSGGALTNVNNLYVGNGGNGALNISGSGELKGFKAGSATYVGDDAGCSGVVNQTGGTWDNGGRSIAIGRQPGAYGQVDISGGVCSNIYNLTIGDGGNGVLDLSGDATLLVDRSGTAGTTYVGEEYSGMGGTGVVNQTGGIWNNGGRQLRLGAAAGSHGEFSISDGVLTNVARLYMGVGSNSVGVLSIVGSDAAIYVNDELRGGNAGSATLRMTPDSGGISPIHVLSEGSPGEVWLNKTALEVDFANCDSTDDLTIIDQTYAVREPFMATNILTKGWTVEVEYAIGAVRLINITRPPKGFVMSIR